MGFRGSRVQIPPSRFDKLLSGIVLAAHGRYSPRAALIFVCRLCAVEKGGIIIVPIGEVDVARTRRAKSSANRIDGDSSPGNHVEPDATALEHPSEVAAGIDTSVRPTKQHSERGGRWGSAKVAVVTVIDEEFGVARDIF